MASVYDFKQWIDEVRARKDRMKYIRAIGLLAALLSLLLVWDEIPAWRPGGTAVLPLASVSTKSSYAFCPKQNTLIEFRGDSLVVGGRMGGSSEREPLPYGRVFARELDLDVRVILRGRGGSTAVMGEEYWKGVKSGGELVFLAYGTNDAAPRGWVRARDPVPISEFEASLSRQVEREIVHNNKVILMAPPPGGSQAINRRLVPYRKAVARVGEESGVTVIDPADALSECSRSEPLLAYDALHLNVAGHYCLGEWLAENACSADVGPSNSDSSKRSDVDTQLNSSK